MCSTTQNITDNNMEEGVEIGANIKEKVCSLGKIQVCRIEETLGYSEVKTNRYLNRGY